jgi:ATP-dependent Clp protease protease subunit
MNIQVDTTQFLPIPAKRQLFLDQDVDSDSLGLIIEQVTAINEDDEYLKKIYAIHGLDYKPKPFKLHINSFGGDLYSCLGFLSFMTANPTPIDTVVTGCAMSAAFLIAISGTHRTCYKNATYMAHQLSFDGSESSTLKCAAADAVEGVRLQKVMEAHVLKYSKLPKAKLKKIYDNQIDLYFDADDAIKYGMVDEVIQDRNEKQTKILQNTNPRKSGDVSETPIVCNPTGPEQSVVQDQVSSD